ncbi:23S rRNA (pseudouridine1915-N3)-methyltransferase [Chitinophaga rupis]|uniref:Ribosomal RNA large subunit methyltransferase H n=2 Tax=Chitinophagaceae TaxID=563835 RepID=A0A1H7T8X0_9BACT|nr:23S rRNA (pseudouridine1915-N3)-methyltransferase [Chitinophaga rupis]
MGTWPEIIQQKKMKIQLWSIGKENDPYIKEGIAIYQKRLQHYVDFELRLIPTVKQAASLSIPELKKQEAKIILDLLQPQDYLLALDEHGKMMTTLQLADFLQQRTNAATRQLVLLIGGAFGLDASILQRAQGKLSLSQLTFPHQLVRLIVTEQLYRAYSVLHNEKYHHQ